MIELLQLVRPEWRAVDLLAVAEPECGASIPIGCPAGQAGSIRIVLLCARQAERGAAVAARENEAGDRLSIGHAEAG